MFLNGSDKNMMCVPEVAYVQINNEYNTCY